MTTFISSKTTSLALILFLSGCAAKQEAAAPVLPETLPVIEIAATAATTWSEYPASVEGSSDLELRPQVEGYLEQVFVNEGAYVTAGQSIFRINDHPYR